MKSNEKKLIVILVVVAVLILIIYFATRNTEEVEETSPNIIEQEQFTQTLGDGTKLNTSTKLNEVKYVNGLEFGNIQLTNQNGQSVLLADVKNNTENATELMLVDIILLDNNLNEMISVSGIIPPLKSGEMTQFNTSMVLDYSNAYDFKVEIK